jgi:hypothetical protein
MVFSISNSRERSGARNFMYTQTQAGSQQNHNVTAKFNVVCSDNLVHLLKSHKI